MPFDRSDVDGFALVPKKRAGWGSWTGNGAPGVLRPDPMPLRPQVDRTQSLPEQIAAQPWPKRSLKEMADCGAIPAGLPLGLNEYEKKLWLALYCNARDVKMANPAMSVTSAVDQAVANVLPAEQKHSVEYNFAMHWKSSVRSCLKSERTRLSRDHSNRAAFRREGGSFVFVRPAKLTRLPSRPRRSVARLPCQRHVLLRDAEGGEGGGWGAAVGRRGRRAGASVGLSLSLSLNPTVCGEHVSC